MKYEYLTVEKDFRHGSNWAYREPSFMTQHYGPAEIYKNGEIRKNAAGSWDAFIDGKCISQTVGKGGAKNAIDSRTTQDLFG